SALIYDEKVSKSEVFEKQRTRWISAQYHYMLKVMPTAFAQLTKGNFDYFYKALQLALPPRLLLPGVLFVFGVLFLALDIKTFGVIWLIMFVANIVAYTAAIPAQFWNKDLWKGVVALPQAFFITLKAMFKLKGANTKFIHTPHTVGKVISSK
ncbi:hypothetical protein N9R81_06380, partial [Flavobacteriales bacterium]|nr:hypothetical protein [Flavobacteriales bacterium]